MKRFKEKLKLLPPHYWRDYFLYLLAFAATTYVFALLLPFIHIALQLVFMYLYTKFTLAKYGTYCCPDIDYFHHVKTQITGVTLAIPFLYGYATTPAIDRIVLDTPAPGAVIMILSFLIYAFVALLGFLIGLIKKKMNKS